MKNFEEQIKQRFQRELQSYEFDQNEDYESSLEQSFFEKERKRMEDAVKELKHKKENDIVREVKKINEKQSHLLDQFAEEINDLKKITNNDQKNIIDQQKIDVIKRKVFNQSMLNKIELAEDIVEQNLKKEQKQKCQQFKQQAKQNRINFVEQQQKRNKQAEWKEKMEKIRVEKELSEMQREDQLSSKYENHQLSSFFKDRFLNLQFEKRSQNSCPIQIPKIKTKSTFSSLQPLPNLEEHVKPKNSPQIALRKMKKQKNISLISTSKTKIKIKVVEKKVNQQKRMEKEQFQSKDEEKKLQSLMKDYIQFIRPKMKKIKEIGREYKPKFINEFLVEGQQTHNIDAYNEGSKSLGEALELQNPINIKEVCLTFEKIKDLHGIGKLENIQQAAFQYNMIQSISQIERCTKLIEINLSYNKLKSIQELEHHKWLRYLNVEHNLIEELCLKGGALEILFAGHNKIEQIRDLSNNVYLRKLYVNDNKLHKLNGMNQLYFLEEINIGHNFIDDLQGIKDCLLLRVLNASNNRINCLTEKFSYLFLNEIDLTDNLLTQLPHLFLPSLEKLILIKNKLAEGSSSVKYLPNLKILNLDENELKGFGIVWSLLRYSKNLSILKYDQNQCFLFIRQKVKELYEYIIYRSMNKLEIINQSPYDLGVKKYYESAYEQYLSNKPMFERQTRQLESINNKIMFLIKENRQLGELEKEKKKFSETKEFITYKSVERARQLFQIMSYLYGNQSTTLLRTKNSLFYFHDLFQDRVRSSIHKIRKLVVLYQYKKTKRRNFFIKKKPEIENIIKQFTQIFQKYEVHKAIKLFHKPLQGINEEKATIIIQKNWRMYRTRKRYKKIIAKLKNKDIDSQLQEVDLDDFQMQIPSFDFDFPEEVNFDQYIIRPQIFKAMEQKQQERQQKYRKKPEPQEKIPMVNNFMENNSIPISEQSEKLRHNQRQQKMMKQWHFKNEKTFNAFDLKRKQKEARLKKEAQKNLTAAQRYEKFKKNAH